MKSATANTAAAVPAARPQRRGRKPLTDGVKRRKGVSVRFNPAEMACLDRVRGKVRLAEWLRMAALGKLPPAVPAINLQAWDELRRLCGNLNQSQTAMNRGDADRHQEELIRALLDAVNALRRELIGLKR